MFLFIFEQNPRESNNKGDTCSLTWLCRIPSTLDSNWVSQRTFLVNGLRHQSLCSTSKMMASRSSYIHKAFAVKHCWNWLQSKMLCTIVDSFCTGVTSVVAWRFFHAMNKLLSSSASKKTTKNTQQAQISYWFPTRFLLLYIIVILFRIDFVVISND